MWESSENRDKYFQTSIHGCDFGLPVPHTLLKRLLLSDLHVELLPFQLHPMQIVLESIQELVLSITFLSNR